MASSRSDDGFATPAAATISLAIGVIASAVVAASVGALRQERADYGRVQAQFALEGAQAQAAFDLASGQTLGPTHWQVRFGGVSFEAIAEPELPKLSLTNAAALADTQFTRWGIGAPAVLKARLETLAAQKTQVANLIAPADSAANWRLCARSAISPYGVSAAVPIALPTTLQPGAVVSRTGQLWRLRLASGDGWVDDRIVRFTGAADHPLSVAAQTFGRGAQMGNTCQALDAAKLGS